MRPRERVERTRRALALTVATRAAFGALAAGLIAAGFASLISRRVGVSSSVPVWTVAGIIGGVVLGLLFRPWRRLTIPRVALWIEERVPSLQYALVTSVDPVASGPNAAALEYQIERVSWDAESRRAMTRAVSWPVVAALGAAAAFAIARRIDLGVARMPARATPTVSTTASRNVPAPFSRLSATVRAPDYAGARVVRVESPASIAALVGSSIALESPGSADGISAAYGDQPISVQREANGWRTTFNMGARPTLVRLRYASTERIVALEPRADSGPMVRLVAPARDTVMRVARGSLPLSAEAHDDIGLANAQFEYIVSSGEGESFKFKSGTLGARKLNGASDGSLTATLGLESLGLKPGDMVHLRAIARDGNTVTGPGVGSSETRVVRVARSGEYDSIAVEGAPPPEADKSLISQRMLIMMTEALERRRASLARDAFVGEARGIGRDQTRLRKRVGDIIFQRLGDNPSGEEGRGTDEEPASDSTLRIDPDSVARDSVRRAARRAARSARDAAVADSADSARAALLRAASAATGKGEEILDFEGDETPVVAINRPLLEAYNAMWEASRELDLGETGRALPPMRRALAAIQRARQAERIYLRGKAPAVVVDLAHVRLTGKETGAANTRAPRVATDPEVARRAERLANAIALAAQSPAAAIDSVVMLRVESLDAAPALATALADALDAMRSGRDATALLARARRIADGSIRGSGRLGAWSGVW